MSDNKDIIEQVNSILKISKGNPFDIYVIHKDDKTWFTESVIDKCVKVSPHSSRVKALNSFFSRHSGIKRFYIILED